MEGTGTARRCLAAALAVGVVTSAAGARSADRLVVPLHPLPALSSVPSAAKGTAVVDRAGGRVDVEAHDLPPLPQGEIYELLLVDNTPGPGHSVALDAGDDILDVGPLEMQGGVGRLSVLLDVSRLSSFGLDMVAVIREMPDSPAEQVLGGLVSIRDKAAGDPSLDTVLEGARLFSQETFEGNGRTCATCHPPANNFTLSPEFIKALPSHDPLFVAEFVPALADLENPRLMRGPRALILENIDGFDRPPVFRGTPHILNAALTGPYGMSGDVPTLGEFALGAIVQHAPRRLDRIPGIDFRLPSQEELDAMEAFQLSVLTPPVGFVSALKTDQQRRGRDLFFGEAKCSLCHDGPALDGKGAFNTGIVTLPQNRIPLPECPSCGPLGQREAGGEREFNVPPLVGIARTAPFFHDNSVPTLREAVAFYDSAEFNSSPGGRLLGGIQLRSNQIDDLTAFLAALTLCGNGVIDPGEACDDGNLAAGDGCRADCSVDICGDGILDPGETCDDGAVNGRDGCCSADCLVDGDGTCDRDGCPNLPMLASAMIRIRKVAIDYAASGPGGGDDALRVIDAVFSTRQTFDPATSDDVHVTLESVGAPTTLLSTTLPAGSWVRKKTPRHLWVFFDRPQNGAARMRRAKLKESRPGVYTFRMNVAGTSIVTEHPNRVGDGLRLVVEIGQGVCAEGRLLACTSMPTVDRCGE